MSKPTEAAHLAVYGTTGDELMDALGEDGVARVTEAILDELDHRGDAIASEQELSAALVTGDRAEQLLEVDRENW